MDNPIGKALWGSPSEPNRILLRQRLTAQHIDDHLLALFFRGFRQTYDVLSNSRAFLSHLVLHEVAHIKHDWKQDHEVECDEWAFSNLKNWLET